MLLKKSYDFTFERRTLVRIIGVVAILNLLVFAAGIFTGLSITFPELVKLQKAQSEATQLAAAKSVPPPPIANPPEAPAPAVIAEEDMPAVDADAPAADSGDPAASVADTAALPAGVDPDAPALPADAPQDPSKYSLQVGAFLSSNNADVLLEQLKVRGYTPFIFDAPDSKGRAWHLVRIGKFSDRLAATSAATNFQSKERMTALVRPSNSM